MLNPEKTSIPLRFEITKARMPPVADVFDTTILGRAGVRIVHSEHPAPANLKVRSPSGRKHGTDPGISSMRTTARRLAYAPIREQFAQ
jgi:hypothetical protein